MGGEWGREMYLYNFDACWPNFCSKFSELDQVYIVFFSP